MKNSLILPIGVSLVEVRGTLNKAERKCGGAGRLGVDVTAGFVIVDVTDVIVVDGLINVFADIAVVERLFAVAEVKFPLAWASI